MNGANEDPYDWSVQQVVDNLCYSPQLPGAEGRSLQRPDPILFETKLRENDINGEVLLGEVDKDVIKGHLGISSFGQIIAVERAIKHLKNNSSQWALKHPTVVDSRPTVFSPVTPYSHPLHQSVPPGPSATNSRLASPQHAYPYPPFDQSSGRLPSHTKWALIPPISSQPALRQSVETTESKATGRLGAPRIKESESAQPEEVQSDNNADQEYHRPVLGGTDSVDPLASAPLPAESSSLQQGQLPIPQAQSGNEVALPVKRKRLAPTLIATSEEAALGSSNQYYGHNRLPIDNIFYGRGDLDDSREFSFEAAGGACGTQRWISGLMKHYLQQTIQSIPTSKASALVPYSANRLKSLPSDRRRQQFTMFESRGRCKVSDMDDWPDLQLQDRHLPLNKMDHQNRAQATLQPSSPRSWDFVADIEDSEYQDLLIRYPVQKEDEEEIAIYADDAHSIGSYDEETWMEIQEEREEQIQTTKKRPLSEADIESVVSEVVTVLAHDWRERKFPAFARKVFRLWSDSDKQSARSIEVSAAEKRLASFERSLLKVRQEIASHTWNKAEEVRHQCQSLEAFVFQREEERCLIEFLRNDVPPPEPPPFPRRKKKSPLDLPDGEEDLSDDEGYLSEDDIANFIENDLAVPQSTPTRTHTPLAFSDDDTPVKDTRHMSKELSVNAVETNGHMHTTESDDADFFLADDEDDGESEDSRVSGKKRKRSSVSKQSPSVMVLDLGSDMEDSDTMGKKESPRSLSEVVEPWTSASRPAAKTPTDLSVDVKPTSANKARQRYTSHGNTNDDAIAISSDDPLADVNGADQTDSASGVRTPRLEPSVVKAEKTPRRGLRIITSSSSDQSPGATSSTRLVNASASSEASLISPGRFALKNLEDQVGILNLTWEGLERSHDHKRTLAKIIYSNPVKLAEIVHDFVSKQEYSYIKELIPASLRASRNRANIIANVPQEQTKTAFTICTLYASYASCKNLLEPKFLKNNDLLQDILSGALAEDDYWSFLRDLSIILQCRLGTNYALRDTLLEKPLKRKKRGSAADDSSGDDQTEEHTRHGTPNKKRVKKVKESQEALALQESDQQRVQEFDLRRSILQASFQSSANTETNPIINLKEPLISIHPHIGHKIKEHQVLGTQFLWREIVADPKHQGCLLAHTMGLGKTMQVITLLVTIALAARSKDPDIRKQVSSFAGCRFLILCPPSLVDNWADEFAMWVPEEASAVRTCRKISSTLKAAERADTIVNWYQKRGPLIISYEMLRSIANNSKAQFLPQEHTKLKDALIDGADVVVADEAHKMKNSTSIIAQVAKLFKTRSRIALTGSPLANSLEEYFAMIDWIAPGYLGSLVQFKAKYAEPIKEGLFNDSSPYEQRKSLKKLEILKKDLDPKVCRADISAIAEDLPPKTEFFITVALTSTQRKAYEKFVTAILGSEDPEAAGNARLWDWLAILSLLCNHPQCFCSKLEEREQAGSVPQKRKGNTDDPDGDLLPIDVGSLSQVGLSQSNLRQLLKMFEKMEDHGANLSDPSYSNRALIVKTLVDRSIAEGDKVLIFSHSIPTLDYLQKMLEMSHLRYTRLDGKTAVSKRQEATKDFNRAHGDFDVFLISTRAGGLGLNLPGANRVIIFDFSFNPQWEEQAIGRAYRLGQRKPVFVYRFRAGGTFEEVVYNKAVFKTQLSARVIDKKNPMRWASKNVRDYLFKPKTVEPMDLTEFEEKDTNVLGHVLNNKLILKIELTETFQREHIEELTAEEEKEIREQLEDEQLKRDDFEAWAEKDRVKGYREHREYVTSRITSQTNTHLPSLPGEGPQFHTNSNVIFHPLLDRQSRRYDSSGLANLPQRTRQNIPQASPRSLASFDPGSMAASIMSTPLNAPFLDIAQLPARPPSAGRVRDTPRDNERRREASTGPHHDTLGE